MFNPIYKNGVELRITGRVASENESLKSIFEAQFSHNFWPVSLDELSAKIEYNQINETALDLGGGLTVESVFLNHQAACLGYRFNYKNQSIAFIFDHEAFADKKENEKIIRFLKDVDILVHDAQYTNEEYPSHKGWGHSTLDNAVETAAAAGAKKLVFFHHDPSHTDRRLKDLEKSYSKSCVKCIMAKEGMTLQM